MDVADAIVLDYVFQQIVNRSAKHPLDIALSGAIGGAVLFIVALTYTVRWHDVSMTATAFLGMFVQGFSVGYLQSCFQRLRRHIVPGVRNPLRYLLAPIRISAILVVFCFVAIAAMGGFEALPSTLCVLGSGLWCACFYFESCDCPPVKPKKVRSIRVKLADLLAPIAARRVAT